MVGNALDVITKHFAHLRGQYQLELRFQDIPDTTLTRLGIDADNVRLVHSADVGRVDGKIRYSPGIHAAFHAVFHTLCYCATN